MLPFITFDEGNNDMKTQSMVIDLWYTIIDWFQFCPPTCKEYLRLATFVSLITMNTSVSPTMMDTFVNNKKFMNICTLIENFLKITQVIKVCFV